MTHLERTIMQEIATLSENRLNNVLAYVRFLKFGLDADKNEIEERFDKSWKQVRARAKKLNITKEDIETEIHLVRDGK
jgi:hypothetical protein